MTTLPEKPRQQQLFNLIRSKHPTDECIEWPGSRMKSGYGQIGRSLTHRLSYAAFVGPIPEGLYVCHRCDNPPCINPTHLFIGTQKDNLRDCARKGRRDNRGEGNPLAKLTELDVLHIRHCHNTGVSIRNIAEQRKLDYRHVWKIVTRRQWKHV